MTPFQSTKWHSWFFSRTGIIGGQHGFTATTSKYLIVVPVTVYTPDPEQNVDVPIVPPKTPRGVC